MVLQMLSQGGYVDPSSQRNTSNLRAGPYTGKKGFARGHIASQGFMWHAGWASQVLGPTRWLQIHQGFTLGCIHGCIGNDVLQQVQMCIDIINVLGDCLGESTETIHITHIYMIYIRIDKQSELQVRPVHGCRASCTVGCFFSTMQLIESEYCRIWHVVCPLGLVLCQNTLFVTQKPDIFGLRQPYFFT
jgi:hypothetical protein